MQYSNGFISIHRKMTEWEWYNDVPVKVLFFHLLITANWKDKKWRGVDILRGQKLTSIASLSAETTLSTKQVRTALKKLKMTGEVAIKTTSKNTLITVTNYIEYQDKGQTEGQAGGQTRGKQRANKGQLLNKENKDNKDNKYIKKQVKKKLPDFVDVKSWDDFLEMRKKQNAKPTANAEKLLIKKLEKLSGGSLESSTQILEQSIMNGWKGLFEMKENNQKGDFKHGNFEQQDYSAGAEGFDCY